MICYISFNNRSFKTQNGLKVIEETRRKSEIETSRKLFITATQYRYEVLINLFQL